MKADHLTAAVRAEINRQAWDQPDAAPASADVCGANGQFPIPAAHRNRGWNGCDQAAPSRG
jgi:hypothetical protein